MKTKTRFILMALASVLLMPTLASLAGCGPDTATQVEDPAVKAARMKAGGDLRAYFVKAQGNYDSLSPEDKTAVNAITGSEKNTKEAFGHMVLGKSDITGAGAPPAAAQGGAPAQAGGLPPTGPGAH